METKRALVRSRSGAVGDTEWVRRKYDRRARRYDRVMSLMEGMFGGRALRRRVWSIARGPKILEVGVGTGLSFPFYPPDADLTAVDLSPGMLERARMKAEALGLHVRLQPMDVQMLAFPDSSFDTVVSTCLFCSVPDPVQGLRELRRVVRPGGLVVMLEHMRPERLRWLAKIFDWANPLVRRVGGFNINRRTMENLATAGLRVELEERCFSDILRIVGASPAK